MSTSTTNPALSISRPYATSIEEIAFRRESRHKFEVQSASTMGMSSLFFSLVGIPSMIKNIKIAHTTKSLEGRIVAIKDFLQAPLKSLFSIASIIKSAHSILGITMHVSLIALLSPVLLITGIAYLVMEFAATIMQLTKSGNFIKNQAIEKLLTDIVDIDKSPDFSESDKLRLQVQLIRAKLNELRDFDSNDRGRAYLARRIGQNASIELFDATDNMNIACEDLRDLEKVRALKETGIKLLNMVNVQSKKVLRVHILAMVTLTFAAISLLATVGCIPIPIMAISLLVSGAATTTSLATSVAGSAYIENAKKGVDLRLAIPKALTAQKDQKTWSIWNKTSVAGKIGYVAASIISVGLLAVFDGLIYKSQWITKLRGDGDNYGNAKSEFKRHEITFTMPEAASSGPSSPRTVMSIPGSSAHHSTIGFHPGDVIKTNSRENKVLNRASNRPCSTDDFSASSIKPGKDIIDEDERIFFFDEELEGHEV